LYNNGIFVLNDTVSSNVQLWYCEHPIQSAGIWKSLNGDTLELRSYDNYRAQIYSVQEIEDIYTEDIVLELYNKYGSLLTINRYTHGSCSYATTEYNPVYDYECDTCFLTGLSVSFSEPKSIIVFYYNSSARHTIKNKKANRFRIVAEEASVPCPVYFDGIYVIRERHLVPISTTLVKE
jgi:hypothetical protein